MTVTDKLKGMVEELRQDLNEVKDQVKQLLPTGKAEKNLPVHGQISDHPTTFWQRETDRLFNDIAGGPLSPFFAGFTTMENLATNTMWPRIDITESDREVRIKADLAGLDRKNVEVSVTDGILTIGGEKKYDNEDVGIHHYRRERVFGSFSRSVQVPRDINLDQISAKMKRGVLQVVMPKTKNSPNRSRKISVGRDDP